MFYKNLSLLVVLLGMALPAFSEDVQSIFDAVQEKQLERWEGVDVYKVDQTVAGISTSTYYQRTEVTDSSGDAMTMFVAVSEFGLSDGCIGSQSLDGVEGVEDFDPHTDATTQMSRFRESAELVGTETVDGRKAWHLRATEIDQQREMDGRDYQMEKLSMWVDAKEHVPLRMKIEGTMTADGESQAMTIEAVQSDYRPVSGSSLYEPYRQVVRISGILNAAQQAEMAEAMEKMAEFEQQMAGMPESQRKMMESMMGPQLEMMRKMAKGDGIETEIVTTAITVNPSMTSSDGKPCP